MSTHEWRYRDAFHQRCARCALLKRFEDFEGNPKMPDPTRPSETLTSTGVEFRGVFHPLPDDGLCDYPGAPF